MFTEHHSRTCSYDGVHARAKRKPWGMCLFANFQRWLVPMRVQACFNTSVGT